MSKLRKASSDWEDSLAVGKLGESLFKTYFEEQFPGFHLEHLSNIKGKEKGADFRIIETGKLLEVKVDTAKASPNFFIERYSNSETRTPGGVMRAIEDGCDLYAIFFPNEIRPEEPKLFIYHASAFALRYLMSIHEGVGKQFDGYSSRGTRSWCNTSYIVPKAHFEDLLLDKVI